MDAVTSPLAGIIFAYYMPSIGGARSQKRAKTKCRTAKGRYCKGSRSKTQKNRLDFTTKKSGHVFMRDGHFRRRSAQGVYRRPYRKTRKR
jgi:hypothetical protein